MMSVVTSSLWVAGMMARMLWPVTFSFSSSVRMRRRTLGISKPIAWGLPVSNSFWMSSGFFPAASKRALPMSPETESATMSMLAPPTSNLVSMTCPAVSERGPEKMRTALAPLLRAMTAFWRSGAYRSSLRAMSSSTSSGE